MNYHWRKFKNDKYYLVRYFIVSNLILLLVNAVIFMNSSMERLMNFEFSIIPILLFPIGLIIGVKAPVLIHNCVHGNLKSKIYDQVCGELAGLYVWLGMAAFEINHRMHHVHNDTNLDPHNPEKQNFFFFFFKNNFGGTRPVLKQFLKYHGDTKYNRVLFESILFLHFLGVPLRAGLWFLILGPTWFVLFFMPSYLFHMFVFAHINFVTHQTTDSGEVIILNLDSNLYYRFVNFFGNGVYFHKSHHENPNNFNPQLKLNHSRFLY